MMKNIVYISALLFFCAGSVVAAENVFVRNLKQGDSGQDVYELQKILNSNPKTQIVAFGAGSLGNETTYFGALTTTAVKRFQELYAAETLFPANLTRGTGFVGSFTRNKLESLQKTVVSSPVFEVTPVSPAISRKNELPFLKLDKNKYASDVVKGIVPVERALGTVEEGKVTLLDISKDYVKEGDVIMLIGNNFMPTNSVFIGSEEIKNVVATTTNAMWVQIPRLSQKTHTVSVKNSMGSSQNGTPIYVTVGSTAKNRPEITSSSLTSVGISDTITIQGVGFDAKNNSIYSSLGNIDNISAVSNSLTFKIKDLQEIQYLKDSKIIEGMPVYFRVLTSSGLSSNFGYFIFNGK